MNMCPLTPRISTAPIGRREYLLEEIVATEDLSVARKAFFGEVAFALTTLHTLGVPRPIQYAEQKPI